MSYIEDNLMPNERVLFTARIHPAVFLAPVLTFIIAILVFANSVGNARATNPQGTRTAVSLMALFAVFLFFYAVLLTIRAFLTLVTTEFGITNRRVIAKTGFVRRNTLEILLPKVESLAVDQNILGRVLNFGTVSVTGTGGTKGLFKPIVDPVGVRKKFNQIIESQKDQ